MTTFKVLGPLEVMNGSRVCTPTPPKVRRVLALLLLRANHIVQMDSLIEELWEFESPRSAITTVQTYIYHLRKTFAKEKLNPASRELLETKAPGYVLRVEAGQVDAEIFEQLAWQGQMLLESGHPDKAAEILRQALGMWTGPALGNVSPGSLLQAHTVQLEERRINALELRIQADVQLGRHRELIGELRSLVAAHPLNEWFHGQLIAALSRAGRRSEALQSYQNLRTLLSEELGVDPSPELQRLQHQVLSHGAPETPDFSRRPNGTTVAAS